LDASRDRADDKLKKKLKQQDITYFLSYDLRVVGQGLPDVPRVRLVATDESGERSLGEYTFAHTPS